MTAETQAEVLGGVRIPVVEVGDREEVRVLEVGAQEEVRVLGVEAEAREEV